MTNKKILTLISLLLFLFLLVGCFPKQNLPPEITSEAVTEATVGVAYTYNVVATDPNAGDVLTYSLIDEPTGMVINEDSGVITWTPTAAGDFPVTVEASDGKLSDTQSFTITVIAVEVELIGIEVVPETMTLIVGKSDTIKSVTAYYSDGSTAGIALKDCTYLSSDGDVATVDAGVISALTPGTATITVSYKEEGITKTVYIEESDTVGVTVGAVELDHIVVVPNEMTLYYEEGEVRESGSETIESVTAHYNDGTEVEVDFVDDCTYGLNPIGIVKVEADEITADKVGEATLTVTYEDKTDAIEVTVLAFELDHIVVVPEKITFEEDWLEVSNDSETITSVTAYYNDGSEDDTIDFADCTFVSDDKTIATATAGVITAVAKGTATITVSYEGIEEDVTAEDFITVTVSNRAPSITSVAGTTATVGEAYTYDVDAEDSDVGDVLTYSLPICPSGMEINSTSGYISWTPSVADSGEAVTVRVTDDDEFDPLSDTEEFTIVVSSP